MNHDETCEWTRADWPKFGTGEPFPCHCMARADGRAKAQLEMTGEREYGVVLSSRGGKVMIKILARNKDLARRAVQAEIKSWRIGRFGGSAYTGVHVSRLAEFKSTYAVEFITLPEAVERIKADGFVDMTR